MDRARRLNERVGSGGRRRDRDYPWACFAALKPLSARTCGFESHALRSVCDTNLRRGESRHGRHSPLARVCRWFNLGSLIWDVRAPS